MRPFHRLPVAFIGHGSPMLALEDGAWHHALSAWAAGLEGVRAVGVCSAHWETPGAIRVSAGPGIQHDFSGFSEALYRIDHPVPDDEGWAHRILASLTQAGMAAEQVQRPLDHGVWVPLRAMQLGSLPLVQISLPRNPARLVAMGQALAPLRDEGLLVLGSGGLVHNLRRLDWEGLAAPQPWAKAFEGWVMDRVLAQDMNALQDPRRQAPGADLAMPTSEHFDPILAVMGAAGDDLPVSLFEGWQHGSLSLRAVAWG